MDELDPDQLFVVSALSRESIADSLGLQSHDPRLTDEYCQKIADELYNVDSQFDASDAAIDEMYERFANELE